MSTVWNVTFEVFRKKGQDAPYYERFNLEVNPDEYVLDAVERIWAFHDRSLCFAHACHHSTCGACGMRVNGKEKLTCITPIRDVTHNGGKVKVEPLRNFPVISDLVVDLGSLYVKMEQVGHRSVLPESEEPAVDDISRSELDAKKEYIRLSDCIECGICISVCPAAATNPEYLGPAPLAGAHQHGLDHDGGVLGLVDSEFGVWRCHSAFECSAACPSNVHPAERIMYLRRQLVGEKIKRLFRKN